jgi:hypothetical protein
MITTINDFKNINEASKKKTDGFDLFIIDTQKENNKMFNDDNLKSLNNYSKDFSRVFQLWNSTNTSKPSYEFNNQVKFYSTQQGRKLSLTDVSLLFHKPQQENIINRIKNIPDDYEMFETIHNEIWFYLGFDKWFLLTTELVKLFKTFKKQNRKIIITGVKKSCNLIYHIMRKMEIDVEYNFEFIFDGTPSVLKESKNMSGEIEYIKNHLDHNRGQDDYHMDMVLDDNVLAYVDYSLYRGKLHIKMIETVIKNKGYGLMLMRELAKDYGYENIERNQLTPDGMKMRKKLDDEFNFDYEKHIKNQNKHIKADVIKDIRIKNSIVADFLSDILLLGSDETWKKWLKRSDYNDINNKLVLDFNLDFNDISDISTWIKNSPTNNNDILQDVPYNIKNDLNKLL